MSAARDNIQAAGIFGYPLEWDRCPGCASMFPAKWGKFEVSLCDRCDEEGVDLTPSKIGVCDDCGLQGRVYEWPGFGWFHSLADCPAHRAAWHEAFASLEVPPAPCPAPLDGAGDGSTLSTTVQRIATNSTITTRKVQP